MQVVPELDVRRALDCIILKGTDINIQVLKGAYHSFDAPNLRRSYDHWGNRLEYDAESTEKARKMTGAFLKKFIGK